ncbi:hypothetical protein [Bacillus toyonensis]|uniref:hypothetical protein n=1 Tax=Bacillus toyonensis TaxID=155322 RepID=UPI002175D962|nr:hypothetical protein [Bacillus toyonensis]
MAQFTESEHHIVSLFSPHTKFHYQDNEYTVIESGKPKTTQGEPKTDIYIFCTNNITHQDKEFKISFKQHNADFLENKMTSSRSEQIFGSNWQQRISNFIQPIQQKFNDRPLIYKVGYRRTSAGAITLGWKFELLNKISGELSDSISLTPEEVLEIYSGSKLDDNKRNARVNGRVIPESGVANYVLTANIENLNSAQDAINSIVPINTFANNNPQVYYACKALNYRSFVNKFDGNRPLAVHVNWNVIDNKLTPQLTFGNPLTTGGNAVAAQLKTSLQILNISNTNDINEENVSSTSFIVE